MFELKKAAEVGKGLPPDGAMELINRLTRRELTAEEVYTFPVRACDTLPDRDNERFTKSCLEDLAKLFVGTTVIFDHAWTATGQTARIYSASVEQGEGESHYLRVECYMLRTAETAPLIDAIDGGILKEVSVGCAVRTATCSICGQGYGGCDHRKGQEYDGRICVAELSDGTDAYELSFVAVPAQKGSGVVKSAHKNKENETERARMRLRLEKLRFGGLSEC